MTPWTLTETERQTYRRYAALALPRHTSYPTAPAWSAEYGPAAFRTDLRRSAERHRPLSVYVHIPFCEKLCYYCACTKEIVSPQKRRASDPADALLAGLAAEAARVAEAVGHGTVAQLHLGGGSPTFLNSRGGTFVAGQDIRGRGPVALAVGTEVRVGRTTLVLLPDRPRDVPEGAVDVTVDCRDSVNYSLLHAACRSCPASRWRTRRTWRCRPSSTTSARRTSCGCTTASSTTTRGR
jgi:hypothetical protein